MKLARIVAVMVALLAGVSAASLAGCQTDGGASSNRSSSGSGSGGGAY
ncbi:hypothetical protein [Caballeronia sp. ATUFL_M2_KS44]|nr:hypothetical protein [Caballeronia sp. ATUFL_M2_KS44]